MNDDEAALAALIGGAVRRLRLAAGLSMTELAERAGMTVPYLSRCESGSRSVPTVITVGRLAKALGVPVCQLIDPPPPAPKKRKKGSDR